MKVKTEDLIGPALDRMVAQAIGLYAPEPWISNPSTDWAQGGSIIERERISVYADAAEPWKATLTPNKSEPHFYFRYYGPTLLIAAMRCFVAYKLGDEVEIPDALQA